MILLLLACGAEGDDTAALVVDENTVAYEPGDCSRAPALSYENFGKPFVTRYCTSCHSGALSGADRSDAPVDINLDTYDAVAAQAGRIQAAVLGDQPTMPPGGGPTATEMALLGEWLTCSVF